LPRSLPLVAVLHWLTLTSYSRPFLLLQAQRSLSRRKDAYDEIARAAPLGLQTIKNRVSAHTQVYVYFPRPTIGIERNNVERVVTGVFAFSLVIECNPFHFLFSAIRVFLDL